MSAAAAADLAAIRVPEQSWHSEMRAMRIVWRRELIRFAGDRMRIAMWLVQPLLFLFVLGSGLETLSAASTHGVDLRTFLFPGILCMGAMFTGMFNAASLVWDRELGFLREMLVAPISRSSIIVGKCLGGATVASLQGVIVLALAGLVGVPYDPLLILGVFGLLLLISFTITAFGVLLAIRVKHPQTFMYVMQMLVMPMFFLSGAFFPVAGLPAWLGALNRVDPLTYAVEPMRHLVFGHLEVSEAARHTLTPGLTWAGWHLSPWFEAAMLLLAGLALMSAAVRWLSRTE